MRRKRIFYVGKVSCDTENIISLPYTLKAIQFVAPVIANPQGEAIHTGTLDCFTLRVRDDRVAGRMHMSSCFLFALLKAK
jgi:hypothetical protein